MRSLVMIACLAAAAHVAAQGMYRWVDASGKVHYSDKAPPAGAIAEEKQLRGNVVETSVPGFEAQQAAKNFPVTLYTAPQCGEHCDKARKLLTDRGVPFRETSVATNEQRDALVKLAGVAEVPVMVLGKQIHKGFESGLYTSALDQAGYPKSAVPGQKAAPAAPQGAAQPASAQQSAAPKKGPYAAD